MELEVARDILDQEVLDRNGTRMGRVDGVVMIIDGDRPPRIDRLELGFVVLAGRVHRLAEKLVNAMRRWSVRKEAVQVIPWSNVAEITKNHIKVTIDGTGTPAFDWENFLRDKIVSKIPGSGAQKS